MLPTKKSTKKKTGFMESLVDGFKSLFGKGVFRVSGETVDGRSFIVRVPYVGDLKTYSNAELFAHVKQNVREKHGVTVRDDSLKLLEIVR